MGAGQREAMSWFRRKEPARKRIIGHKWPLKMHPMYPRSFYVDLAYGYFRVAERDFIDLWFETDEEGVSRVFCLDAYAVTHVKQI